MGRYGCFCHFVFPIILLFVGCQEAERTSPAGATSQAVSDSVSDVLITGTLNVSAISDEVIGTDLRLGQREVQIVDDSGLVLAEELTSSDGSYAVFAPGTLAYSPAELALSSTNIYIKSVISDTSDGSVIGMKDSLDLTKGRYIDKGDTALGKITAIRGRVLLDGARDNTGIVIYIPGTSFSARTDSAGNFLMTFIQAGEYKLRFEKDGYLPLDRESIIVEEKETTKLDLAVLKLSGGTSTFSVKQLGEEGLSSSRTVEFLISSGDSDRFKAGEAADVANIPYDSVPELYRHEFETDGTFELAFIFANADGFESTITRVIEVDTQAPAATGILLADRDSLSTAFSNDRNIIAYHETCDDIALVAITEAGNTKVPSEEDFKWECFTSGSDSNANFRIPDSVTTFSYKLWVKDRVGNVSIAGVSGSIIFDESPPQARNLFLSDQTSGSSEGTDITTVNVTIGSCDDTAKIIISESQLLPPDPLQFSNDCSTADNAYSYTFANNISGTKSVLVWAIDHAGNVGQVSGSATMTLDQTPLDTPPTFTLADRSPATAGYTNDVEIDLTVSDCNDVAEVLISETQTTKPTELQVAWKPCVLTPMSYTLLGGEGTRDIHIWTKDIGGNISNNKQSGSIELDSTPPLVGSFTFSAADASSSSNLATNSASINVSVAPCNSDSSYVLVTESATVPILSDFTTLCGSFSSYTLQNTNQGSHPLYFWVRDIAGNISSASHAASISFDTNSPNLPGSFNVSDDDFASILFTNATTLDYAIDSCNGIDYLYLGEDQSTPPSEISGNWIACASTGTVANLISSTAGAHVVYLWTKDEAGNVSAASLNHSITWDGSNPGVPSLSVPSGSSNLYTQANPASISGTAEINSTLVITDTTNSLTYTTSVDGSGNWSFSLPLSDNSQITCNLNARDAAGNLSSSLSLYAKHDTQDPVISNVKIDIRDDQASVSWNTDDSASAVLHYGTTTAYGSTLNSSGFAYSKAEIIPSLSGNTEYFFKIVATDQAGNTNPANDYAGSFRTYIAKSGTISSDETWNLNQTSYLVKDDILVSNGTTLTLSPGTKIRMESGKQIWVEGTLVVRGTSGNEINIIPQSDSATSAYWKSINFRSNSTSTILDGSDDYVSGNILEYVYISGGGSSGDMINLNGTNLAIKNSILENSGSTYHMIGSDAGADELIILDSTLQNISGDAINKDYGSVRINGSTFKNIAGYAIYNRYMNLESEIKTSRFEDIDGTHAVYMRSNGANVTFTTTDNVFVDINGTNALNVGTAKQIISRNIFDDISNTAIYLDSPYSGYVNLVTDNVIANADLGVYFQSYNGRHVDVTNNTFFNLGFRSNSSALYVYSSSPSQSGTFTFSNNTVLETNGGSGTDRVIDIQANSGNVFDINNNNFFDISAPYVLYNNKSNATGDVDATGNYWQTTNASEIDDVVWDGSDDFSYGAVDTSGFLSVPSITAPISPVNNITVTDNGTGSVTIAWNANVESDLLGYKVYYDSDNLYPHDGTGATEGSSGISIGNVLTYTLTGLPPGTHYFWVTALDSNSDGTNDVSEGYESWVAAAKSFTVSN